MEYGIVYLLANPCMPGLVKIGMTERENIDARMKELYSMAYQFLSNANLLRVLRSQTVQRLSVLCILHLPQIE